MAISLASNRVSSHTFTEDEIGGNCINEVRCNDGNYSGYSDDYKLRITCWFEAIDKVNRTVTVAYNSRLYSSGTSYASCNVYTKVFVNDEQKGSTVNLTSLGTNTNKAGAVSGSLTIPYNDDGTLTVKVKATLSGSTNITYCPKYATVECICTYPKIDSVSNIYVYTGGTWKKGKVYVYNNGWKKGVAPYIHDGSSFKKGK